MPGGPGKRLRGRGGSANGTIHVQKIEVGRDYGDRLEVLNGLNEGDTIVQNPGDVVHEGMKVEIARLGCIRSALTFSLRTMRYGRSRFMAIVMLNITTSDPSSPAAAAPKDLGRALSFL